MTWVFWTLLLLLLVGITTLSIMARRRAPPGRRRIVSGRYGFWRSLLASASYLMWAMRPRIRPWDAEPPNEPGEDYAEDWHRATRRRRH